MTGISRNFNPDIYSILLFWPFGKGTCLIRKHLKTPLPLEDRVVNVRSNKMNPQHNIRLSKGQNEAAHIFNCPNIWGIYPSSRQLHDKDHKTKAMPLYQIHGQLII